MKKLNFMIVAAGLLATTCTLHSCKKEEVKETTSKDATKTDAMLKTAQEEEDYYDDMIRTVSYGIADLSTNTVFRQTVSDLVALQFDEDDNIPMVILDSVLAVNGINLKQEMISSLTAHNKLSLLTLVTQAVDGFDYFGDTLYTQIYIPFINGKNIVSTTPTICLNFEGDAVLPSFKKEGTVLLNGTTDEVFATNNNVYVVSVNETIGNGKPKLGGKKGKGSGSTAKMYKAFDRWLSVHEIYISEKKEEWSNGRADISFFAHTKRFACNMQKERSINFCKLANSELNQWYVPTFRSLAIADADPDGTSLWEQSEGEELNIVFYEQDVRKKFNRSIFLFPCAGGVANIVSKEPEYGTVYPFFGDYASTRVVKYDYPLSGGIFKLGGFMAL